MHSCWQLANSALDQLIRTSLRVAHERTGHELAGQMQMSADVDAILRLAICVLYFVSTLFEVVKVLQCLHLAPCAKRLLACG